MEWVKDEDGFIVPIIREQSIFALVDGEPLVQLYSARTYRPEEIPEAEEALRRLVAPLLDRYVIGYAWFGGPDAEPPIRSEYFCVFLMDNRAKPGSIASFRQRLKSMDYEDVIMLN